MHMIHVSCEIGSTVAIVYVCVCKCIILKQTWMYNANREPPKEMHNGQTNCITSALHSPLLEFLPFLEYGAQQKVDSPLKNQAN